MVKTENKYSSQREIEAEKQRRPRQNFTSGSTTRKSLTNGTGSNQKRNHAHTATTTISHKHLFYNGATQLPPSGPPAYASSTPSCNLALQFHTLGLAATTSANQAPYAELGSWFLKEKNKIFGLT